MPKFSNKHASNISTFLQGLIINFRTLIIVLYALGYQSMPDNSNISLMFHNIEIVFVKKNEIGLRSNTLIMKIHLSKYGFWDDGGCNFALN